MGAPRFWLEATGEAPVSHRLWLSRILAAQLAIVGLAIGGGSFLRPHSRLPLLMVAAGFGLVGVWAIVRRPHARVIELAVSGYLVLVIASFGWEYADPRLAQLAFACEMCTPVFGVVFLSKREILGLCGAGGLAAVIGTIHLGGSPSQIVLRSATVLVVVVLPGAVTATHRERLLEAHKETEEARARAEELSRSDPLTGLLNRRGLADAYLILHRSARREGRLLGGLILDVDHFKEVNDTYGHDVGDGVLADVAAAIRHQLRPDDVVARLGGEEFGVITALADNEGLMALAERLRLAVEAWPSRRTVTVSVGASIYDPAGLPTTASDQDLMQVNGPLTQLMLQADTQLYLAKTQGRNRAVGPVTVVLPTESGHPAVA